MSNVQLTSETEKAARPWDPFVKTENSCSAIPQTIAMMSHGRSLGSSSVASLGRIYPAVNFTSRDRLGVFTSFASP